MDLEIIGLVLESGKQKIKTMQEEISIQKYNELLILKELERYNDKICHQSSQEAHRGCLRSRCDKCITIKLKALRKANK